MVSFNPGTISDFDSIRSMLRVFVDKDDHIDIRIFPKDKLKDNEGKSTSENPDDFVCKITGRNDHLTAELDGKIPTDFKQNIICALKMVGMIDLKFSYIKSTQAAECDQTIRMSHSPDFMNLMKKWFETKVFVPDTNLIINHTVSAIELASDPNLFKSLQIAIPRLAVLELERKSNENKPSDNSCSKEEKKKTMLENKRRNFLAFSELVYLQKKDNVGLFPILPPQILAQFPTISSEHNADSWIRHEIQNYVPNMIKEKLSKGGAGTAAPRSFILVTSDLINSLSASSEGIDSIYVSEVRDKNDLPKCLDGSLKQISRFLIILAVLSETIDLSINSTIYRFQGFWQGITNYDIINYRIKTSSHTGE